MAVPTMAEVEAAITALKNNKAPEIDGLQGKRFKQNG